MSSKKMMYLATLAVLLLGLSLTGCSGFSGIARNTETGAIVGMDSVMPTDAALGKVKVEWAENAFQEAVRGSRSP